MARVFSSGSIPFAFIRANNWLDVNFFTKYADMTKPRLKSVHHDTFMLLATVGDSFTFVVMLTGRGGRFGSTPGLFVGMGFYIHQANEKKCKQNHQSLASLLQRVCACRGLDIFILTGNGHNLLLTFTITLGGK